MLLFNVIKCTLETSDMIVLKKVRGLIASKYCKTSGVAQLFLFDMACLITVWHMRVTRKDVEDPTRNAKSATKMPLLISALISIGHISLVLDLFYIGHQNKTCTFINDHKSLKNELVYSFIIIVAPILIYNVYNLQKFTVGPMAQFLKPFIIKQDLIAMNQVW